MPRLKARSTGHIFAAVLCVLALFVAQALNGKPLYRCVCSGKALLTQAAYCDGPHGEACQKGDEQTDAARGDGEDSGSREDHQRISQDLQLGQVDAAAQVTAPQLAAGLLPLREIVFASQEANVPHTYAVDFGDAPPIGVTVARTVSLLV